MKSSQKAIPFQIIDLDSEGYHLKIIGQINNHSANIILDTGASKTAFDQTFITALIGANALEKHEKLSSGLGTNSMECYEAELSELRMGDFTLNNYRIAVLDLSNVNLAYEKLGLGKIHGILGNDILFKNSALIDYGNKQLWLKNNL